MNTASTEIDEYIVELIDTPGFDDTYRDDAEILSIIGEYLRDIGEEVFLRGVIYLHRITENKMQGSGMRSLEYLKTLCGPDNYNNIAIATTMWDTLLHREHGEDREKQLRDNGEYWGELIIAGASVHRHDKTSESARDVVSHLVRKKPIVLQFQKELARTGNIAATSAGQILIKFLEEITSKYEETISDLRKQLEGERKRSLTKQEELQKEIQKMYDAIQDLKLDLDSKPRQSRSHCIPQ